MIDPKKLEFSIETNNMTGEQKLYVRTDPERVYLIKNHSLLESLERKQSNLIEAESVIETKNERLLAQCANWAIVNERLTEERDAARSARKEYELKIAKNFAELTTAWSALLEIRRIAMKGFDSLLSMEERNFHRYIDMTIKNVVSPEFIKEFEKNG